jgi:hypothetical protein
LRLVLRFALVVSFLTAVCFGDQEGSNVPHLAVDESGRCYAKSVPVERYGQVGVTKVYFVEAGEDRLVSTFDWYASQLYIACNVSAPGKPTAVSLVRFGPWHRGDRATEKDLALAIYLDGQLVASYSTLEIAGTPDNVSASVSHYRVTGTSTSSSSRPQAVKHWLFMRPRARGWPLRRTCTMMHVSGDGLIRRFGQPQ